MPQLDSVKLELNPTGSSWVDITTYLELGEGASIHIGRTSPFSAPPPGTLQVVLNNADGRFTPGRQVLADGTTAHPYWPNLLPRIQIRLSWVKGASTYPRFTGYVKGWPTTLPGGHARVPIAATTVDDRLARVTLDPPIRQEVLADSPAYYWPMDDEAGSSAAAEAIAGASASIVHVSDAALTFGDNGPGAGNGPGVQFSPSSGTTGQVLRATGLDFNPGGDFAAEAWINFPPSTPYLGNAFLTLLNSDQTTGIRLMLGSGGVAGQVRMVPLTGTPVLSSGTSQTDGSWHHVAFTYTSSTTTSRLYVDGAQVDSSSTSLIASGDGPPYDVIQIGGGDYYAGSSTITHDRVSGNMGQVAMYDALTLFVSSVAAHSSAGHDWPGETVDERIARFLTYGGIGASGYNLDPSDVALGSYPQGGKDIASAVQDMAVTEGGGSVVYVGVDGKYQFRNRDARTPGAPDLTLDVQADLDGNAYAAAYDDTQIVNQIAGSRATASGTAFTFTMDDTSSQSQYGLISDSFTSYASDGDDVRRNGQDRLATQADPAFRVDQLTVDLSTSSTAAIHANVAALDIGSRIEVTGLPATAAPATILDVYAEGWTENYTADEVTITFDTSPADNPPQMVWDDAEYGRWQTALTVPGTTRDSQLQLSLTASSTSIRTVPTDATVPVFSTSSGDYPMTVVIDAEHISLNATPTVVGAAQLFSSITRGVDGTTAAAHSVAANVNIAPTSTFAL